MTTAASLRIDYVTEAEKCVRFLEKFVGTVRRKDAPDSLDMDASDTPPTFKYMDIIKEIAERRTAVISIELDDVIAYQEPGDEFADNIIKSSYMYLELFARAIDSLLPQTGVQPANDEDVLDVLIQQRIQRIAEQQNPDAMEADPKKALPPTLLRRYEVRIIPPSKSKILSIRQTLSEHIGRMVTVQGIVTRCSEVKPMVRVATYTCDVCGYEIYQEVPNRTFTPLFKCESDQCTKNRTQGKLYLQTRGSKFVKFQELKLQELADAVPTGHIPRHMTVCMYGELTRCAKPGDMVSIAGIFLIRPYTGFQAIRAGLTAETFLMAQNIVQLKKGYTETELDADSLMEIEDLAVSGHAYSKLARSIAPEIWGHEDVKKALLLLLVGGVTKKMEDGMRIRGDINMCLMGDPGVAKSQLLKFITKVAPRAVYTTGRGSSGVGLTAAIMKDPVTGEMILEGGALVLADMGICCIDEFDKMDDSDKTAIHEVMEQQTISICKAGITTTLNARTSILAAANPAWGRYNTRRSPSENINLPAALLSRFDLLFLILDKPNEDDDLRLAQHILHVHMHESHPELEFVPYEPRFLREYVGRARTFEPAVQEDLVNYIVDAYVSMRTESVQNAATLSKSANMSTDSFTYTSARTLLGILRLSQALARLRFSQVVEKEDINEAIRLMHMCKASLFEDEQEDTRRKDPSSNIFQIMRNMLQALESRAEDDETITEDELRYLNYREVENAVRAKGWSQAQLRDTLAEYERINVLTVNQSKTRIMFIEGRGMEE